MRNAALFALLLIANAACDEQSERVRKRQEARAAAKAEDPAKPKLDLETPATTSSPAVVSTSTAAITRWNKLFPALQADVLDPNGNVLARALPLRALLSAAHQPSVFAFWATYCAPCLEEIPMFDALTADGHRIAGVSLDSNSVAKVRAVLTDKKPKYPIGVLTPASTKSVGAALEAGLPFTVILDPEGDVSAVLSGAPTRELILSALSRAHR